MENKEGVAKAKVGSADNAAKPDATVQHKTAASSAEHPKANDTPPSIEEISDMVEKAAERLASKPELVDAIVDAVIGKVDFDKLTADAVESKLPTKIALKELVETAVKDIDMTKLVDEAIDGRAEREAEAQRAAEAEQQAQAAANQRATAAAARKAEKAVSDAEDAALAKRQRAADRAEREYIELVGKPVASAIDFRTAESVELRFADGRTFLPEFALDIEQGQLADEDGRPILMIDIEPSRELVPFEASEAIMLVEGGKDEEPIGVWRAELFPAARIGGGTQPRFPSGSLAFRKVEPAPVADEAAA